MDWPFLTDPRDQVLLAATPALMAPRFSALPEIEPDRRRYIVAADGVYLEARNEVLDVCHRIAPAQSSMPFGTAATRLHLTRGLIPRALLSTALRCAVAASPDEWAGLIVGTDDGYRLVEPPVESRSAVHVTYRRDRLPGPVVMDVHSHGHGNAFFSVRDDQSDVDGFHISVVLGRCLSPQTIALASRLCVHGTYLTLRPHEIWRLFSCATS